MTRCRGISRLQPNLSILQRVFLAVIGGYLLSAGIATWAAWALAKAKVESE